MKIVSPKQMSQLAKTLMGVNQKWKMPAGNGDKVKTDDWYDHQPEWGSNKATKKARKITPGQSVKEDLEGRKDHADWRKSKNDQGETEYHHAGGKMYIAKTGYHPTRKFGHNEKKSWWTVIHKEKGFMTSHDNVKHAVKSGNEFHRTYKQSVSEEVAGVNTSSIPSPATTVQGPTKKKFHPLTKHYIEIMGKRRRIVK